MIKKSILIGFVIASIEAHAQRASDAESTSLEALSSNNIKIQRILSGGDGCPQGSVASLVSQEGDAVTIIFDEFIANKDPFGPPTVESRCVINLGISAPAGWQFAVVKTQYRGSASLDNNLAVGFLNVGVTPGASATDVGWSGARIFQQSDIFRGPFEGNFTSDFDFTTPNNPGYPNLPWSKCGADKGNIAIETALRAKTFTDGLSALISMDSLDAQVSQRVSLRWRQCPNPNTGKTYRCRSEMPVGKRHFYDAYQNVLAADAVTAIAIARENSVKLCQKNSSPEALPQCPAMKVVCNLIP